MKSSDAEWEPLDGWTYWVVFLVVAVALLSLVGNVLLYAKLREERGRNTAPIYTTAQLRAIWPSTVGQLIYNSTIGELCVSTSTKRGGWARAGQTPGRCE